MIVDIHTHLVKSNEHFEPQLINDFIRCGIDPETWNYSESEYLKNTAIADKVVVFALKAKCTGWNTDNRYVSDFVSRHPEKYIYFASIDPYDSDYMDQLTEEHQVFGAKGVKVGPIYQGFHPLSDEYRRIYQYCQQEGLPIMTHMATTFSSGVPLEYARPIFMDQVACEYPDLKIVLAHLGHPWEEECVAAVRHQPNLFADISALFYRPIRFYRAIKLIEEYNVWNKIFFGSDFPATTTQESIEALRGCNHLAKSQGMPMIDIDKIEEIINRDSLRILGIT